MDLDDILALPKYHRRSFFGLTALSVFLLILVDVYILGYGKPINEIASEIIGHVIAGVTSAILILLFLEFFIPRSTKSGSLVQVPPTEITAEFEELLTGSTRWRFKGNFGRYLRGKVLPTLALRSRVDVDASIIDPRNSALCSKHALYRGEINAIDKGRMYAADDVAREAVVTILNCAWYVENRGVSIDLYLTGFYDPMRIDACDNGMIVTMEDRRHPALKLTSDNFMYDHFMTHMRYVREQGEKVDLTGFKRSSGFHQVDESDISAFMRKIGMEALCDRLGPAEILADCRSNYNPYTS